MISSNDSDFNTPPVDSNGKVIVSLFEKSPSRLCFSVASLKWFNRWSSEPEKTFRSSSQSTFSEVARLGTARDHRGVPLAPWFMKMSTLGVP